MSVFIFYPRDLEYFNQANISIDLDIASSDEQ